MPMLRGAIAPPAAPFVRSVGRADRTASVVMRASNGYLPSPANFNDPECSSFSVAIMGDLHLPKDAAQMGLFNDARDQLRQIATEDNATARLVQLGDLGSYERGWPGSQACFSRAREYITSFDLPAALVLGNHDLEGDDFETDEENLAAWQQAFSQRHYWLARLGPATLIGLSTVRFRSNPFSVHEVHVDEEQIAFLEQTLQDAAGGPVVLFTHAPIMGSGLKVVQAVHVKNRCAWVNHSSAPDRFIRIVQAHPNIKLWFSGHFHLSQNYPDSVSVVGGTAFVLTGVIGDDSTRDGLRHSRLLRGTAAGFELYTVDHDSGSTRLDLRGSWEGSDAPEYLLPEDEMLCDPSSGWLCSKVDCAVDEVGAQPPTTWFNVSPTAMLSLQDGLLVEYDVATMSAVGAVFLDVPEGTSVRLVDATGAEVDAVRTDGSAAVAVEVVDADNGAVLQRAERNAAGGFYQIWQPNKWVARKAKEAAERARRDAEAVAAA